MKCKALFYLISLNFDCFGVILDNSDKFEKLTLKWRLLKNPENELGANKAAFIFTNNGPETIKDKKVLPLVWDNTRKNIDLGYRIANTGVLCDATNLNFHPSYNSDPSELGIVWAGYQDAIDPYVMTPLDVFKSINFDKYSRLTEKDKIFGRKSQKIDANMARQHLKIEAQKNIVGMQAQLWSETIKGSKMLDYFLAPKLFAFAEKTWSNPPIWECDRIISKRVNSIWAGWANITNQIGQREFSRLDFLFDGYNYRIATPGAVFEDSLLKANVVFPGFAIR